MAAKRRTPARAKPKRSDGANPRKKPAAGGARAKRGGPLRTLKWGFVVVLWLALIAAGFVGYYGHDLPDTDRLAAPVTPRSVSVLAADGSEIANYGEMWGELVPVSEMAPALPQAVLAIEDRRFFEHGGVDAFGVIRAAWRNAVEGRLAEGGSTISQQLAKLVFLSPERSVKRKIQEAMLAFWLERTFSKEEILTIYMNRAYFGAGAYGVDAAARRYFGRTARDVTLPQAAMIAGLLKAPSRYSPAGDPERAKARARVVLDAMVDAGFLEKRHAADARGALERLKPFRVNAHQPGHFADWVLEQFPGFVGEGHGTVRVRTTLRPALQKAAETAVAETLRKAGKARRIGEAALVALDPEGAVVAMVGGRDYRKSQFNRATQARRQPGSAFKTVVYLAAVEAGIAPDDRVEDAPITLAGWSPRNYDGKFRGLVTVREAFAYSINTVAVRMSQKAGVKRIRATAQRLGIESDLPADASLSLGTGEVTLIELTAAYTALANGGIRVLPHGIAEIRDRSGQLLYGRSGSGAGRVIGGGALAVMRDLLSAAVAEGTGRNAALAGPHGPGYGKTGTSQRFRDAWFVGWAGDLTVGVWLGNDDGEAMDGVTGAGAPAELWRDFMESALR